MFLRGGDTLSGHGISFRSKRTFRQVSATVCRPVWIFVADYSLQTADCRPVRIFVVDPWRYSFHHSIMLLAVPH